jgi:hypothetical protein
MLVLMGLILEFGTLAKLTKKPFYYDKAKNALVQLSNRRSKIGLVGEEINVETGEWVSRNSHVFAPEETLDLDKVVFNTEAHPFRRSP